MSLSSEQRRAVLDALFFRLGSVEIMTFDEAAEGKETRWQRERRLVHESIDILMTEPHLTDVGGGR